MCESPVKERALQSRDPRDPRDKLQVVRLICAPRAKIIIRGRADEVVGARRPRRDPRV